MSSSRSKHQALVEYCINLLKVRRTDPQHSDHGLSLHKTELLQNWEREVVEGCEQFIGVVLVAINNPRTVAHLFFLDIPDNCTVRLQERAGALTFNATVQQEIDVISTPRIILDSEGVFLGLYLPGALSPPLQVSAPLCLNTRHAHRTIEICTEGCTCIKASVDLTKVCAEAGRLMANKCNPLRGRYGSLYSTRSYQHQPCMVYARSSSKCTT